MIFQIIYCFFSQAKRLWMEISLNVSSGYEGKMLETFGIWVNLVKDKNDLNVCYLEMLM